jgi:E3 ubiquitin-protein ligase TRAF7
MSGHFQSWDSTEDDNVATLLADEAQKSLKVFCPLCDQIYQDPHVTSCGHTFCRRCASSGSEVCPLDSTKLALLVRNLAVADEVGELLIHCRYGCRAGQIPGTFEVDPSGCPVKVKLGKRQEHEADCGFAPVYCPNSSLCGKMLRTEYQTHIKTCRYQRCPHYKYNCLFQGSAEEIENHLNTCKFEGVKGFLHQMEGEVRAMKSELEKRDETIRELTSSLSQLTARVEDMEKSSSVESHRVEYLEKQQTELGNVMTHTKKSVSIMLRELTIFQQQMGVGGTMMEQQHLFKCQGTFVGHKGPVCALARSNDLIFSASADCTIKVWDLSATYAGPKTLTGHADMVLALFVHNDTLFSGSNDMTVKVWSLESFKIDKSFQAHEDPVCTLTGNDTYLFSGSLKSIKVWDRQSYSLVRTLPNQNHWVRTLEVGGKHLYSGSYQAVKVWNLDTLEVAHVLKCKGASIYSLAVTDKHIVCGTYENMIQVWDVHSLQDKGILTGHTGAVYALAVLRAPGRDRLFSASYDKTIRVWNLELMMCAQTLVRHEGSVTCLLTSGGRIFSGAVDNTVKLWQ